MICPGMALPLAFANGPEGGMVRYAVKPGETVASIAARAFDPVCGSGAVARINHLSGSGKLAPNQVLLIPRLLLRIEKVQGVMEGFRGPVALRFGGHPATPARVGDAVGEGVVIETGADAVARIGLPDGSRIAIPSNSQVRIDRLRQLLLTGALDRRVALLDGRAVSTVTHMPDATWRYVVSTPVAVSAVRGTVYRASYDAKGRKASYEVLNGVVAVTGGGREVVVHAGQGVTAGVSGVSDPIPLPAAPMLDRPEVRQPGGAAGFDIHPAPGVVRHHIRIAVDAAFTQVVRDSEQIEGRVSLADLPDGDYTAAVTDIAATGLEGLPTTFAFHHVQHELTGLKVREERSPGLTRYTFAWSPLAGVSATYRFTLAPAGAATAAAAVIDRPALTAAETSAQDLPVGRYLWRVTAEWTQGGAQRQLISEPQPFTVIAPDR